MMTLDDLYPEYQRYYRVWVPEGRPAMHADAVYAWVWSNWTDGRTCTAQPFVAGRPWADGWDTFRIARERRGMAVFLDLPEVQPELLPTKRRLGQPTFHPKFETLNDIHLRLRGTLIFVGTHLFFVDAIYEWENDYLLILKDRQDHTVRAWYNRTPGIDLRSIEPQYVTMNGKPGYVYRPPYRQNRQGMSYENLCCKWPGEDIGDRLADSVSLMQGLTRETHTWSPQYKYLMKDIKVMPALRLSRDLAFYTKEENILAEYRGRTLGVVDDNTVMLDRLDFQRSWIKDAIRSVGCSPREET